MGFWHLRLLSNREDFREGGYALKDLLETILAQGQHCCLAGGIFYLMGRGFLNDEFLYPVIRD